MEDRSPAFGLVVRFTVRPGAEDAFQALVARTVAQMRATEPGTLVYNCHRVDGAPRQWIFYELYRDRAAFDAHEQQEHVRLFLAEREPLLEGTEVDFVALEESKTPVAAE